MPLERQPVGYRPGLGLFELGELAPAKVDLRETALPFMQDLDEATHQTVHLGIRDGLDVVYAEKIRGHRNVTSPPASAGGCRYRAPASPANSPRSAAPASPTTEEARLGVACGAAPVVLGREAAAAVSLTVPADRINTAGLAPAIRAVSLALARTLAR